jgi:uncharacterized lipoprotein YddW (UPF0748 family)
MRKLLLITTVLLPLSLTADDFRGAWIASVHNINFPSSQGLSVEGQKAQIIRLLDAAKRCRLNALMVQVRPESDALYPSRIEPWSRYLSGTQGVSPGYDPLAFFIGEAKKRGIEVHAWLNPYRGAANASLPRAANHISRRYPQYAYRIGTVLWMDPGAPAVQENIVNVVSELVERYEIAGIHFDDYFYPYPTDKGHVYPFPDDATYVAYRARGGMLPKADWRRDNVNTLIRRVAQVVHSQRAGLKFGVSPFGIYMPGVPAGIQAGVNQYEQLYGDPVRWMREGWIDYLAPQLYWRDGGPQSFSSLLRWWRSPQANPRGVPVWPGIALDRLSSHGWPSSEIARQLQVEKSVGSRLRGGVIFWNIKALLNNTKSVNVVVAGS